MLCICTCVYNCVQCLVASEKHVPFKFAGEPYRLRCEWERDVYESEEVNLWYTNDDSIIDSFVNIEEVLVEGSRKIKGISGSGQGVKEGRYW